MDDDSIIHVSGHGRSKPKSPVQPRGERRPAAFQISHTWQATASCSQVTETANTASVFVDVASLGISGIQRSSAGPGGHP